MFNVLAFLERERTSHKLTLGFSVLVAMTLFIGVYCLHHLRSLNVQIQDLYNVDLLSVSHVKDAEVHLVQIGRALRHAALADEEAERQRALSALSDAETTLRKNVANVRERAASPEVQAMLDTFEKQGLLYQQNVRRAVDLLQEGKKRELLSYLNEPALRQSAEAAALTLDQVTDELERDAGASALEAQEVAERSTRLATMLILVGLALSAGLGYLISASIKRPLTNLQEVVERLAQGHLDQEIPHADLPNEIGSLARSVGIMQEGARQVAGQRWVKTHLAQISADLQGAETMEDLAQRFFRGVAPLLKIGQGVFYLHEEGRLRLLGGYALQERRDQPVELGQGLVGQSALERKPLQLANPPADYLRIGSGLGEAPPNTLLALPILNKGQLLGALELATFETFDSEARALLDGTMPLLAMNLEILERSARTRNLLEETRFQAESMERQAARLEEQTVELEAQQSEIRATETWYRGILESAPDGLVIVDSRGVVLLANLEAEAMFAEEPGALLGANLETFLPGVLQGGSGNRELLARRRDGQELPVEVGTSRLPAQDGRGACLCVALRDVRERKEAEARLEAVQERSRALLSAVSDGVIAMDRYGIATFANPAAARILGYEAEDLVGRGFHALAHHHRADGTPFPQDTCPMYQVSQDGQPRTADDEVLWHRDGHAVPVEYSTTPLYEEGGVMGTVTVFRDVSSRRAAEQRLQQAFQALADSKALIQVVVDHSPASIYVKDLEGRFLLINRRFGQFLKSVLGLDGEQLLGRVAEGVADPEQVRWDRESDEQVLASGRMQEFMHVLERPTGTEYRQVFKFPVRDSEGRIQALGVIGADVTDQTRTRAEATRAREELQALVAQLRLSLGEILGVSGLFLHSDMPSSQVQEIHRAAEDLQGLVEGKALEVG